jgi:hypothetical protein
MKIVMTSQATGNTFLYMEDSGTKQMASTCIFPAQPQWLVGTATLISLYDNSQRCKNNMCPSFGLGQ